MAISTRLLRRRMKSVANTRKITRAMELVAASKMRKSVQLVHASRQYSNAIERITRTLRKGISVQGHPLLSRSGPSKRMLVVVAASDRGLCGGFNAQVLKKTLEFLRARGEPHHRVVAVGRRAEMALRRSGSEIFASFEAISGTPSYDRAAPIGQLVVDQFQRQEVDRVFLVYMDFRSAISQIPTVMQLLPIIPESELSPLAIDEENDDELVGQSEDISEDLLIEPTPFAVMEAMLPRLVETQLYQVLLESSASEHASRMVAMRSATDNASGMLDDLTFTFNQARQATITREISEISAGKAAIE